jgi:hypothetical protein
MTSRNQVGAKQCRDCVHYANSEVLLCAPNPTRLKTEDCEYYELEKPKNAVLGRCSMTSITVPDDMTTAVEQFVAVLQKTKLHTRKVGDWLSDGLTWIELEQKSIAQRPAQDVSDIAVTDRVRTLLKLTGEAFVSPSGLEVSSRVLTWMLNAYAKQELMTVSEAQAILDCTPEGDRFWKFMQLLDDAALNALVQILERELKR